MQKQYQENDYTRCSELMQFLLVVEQNNQLILKHYARPSGSTPFPEVNVALFSYSDWEGRGCGRGRNRYCGLGRGQ